MKKELGVIGLMLSMAFAAGTVCAGDASTPGPIATVSLSEGMVLVNQGKFYVTARPGQQLNVGDRIMTMAGASATIAYNDGCVQQLKPNNKLVFKSVAECSAKTAKIESVGPHYAELGSPINDVGVGGGVGGSSVGGVGGGGGGFGTFLAGSGGVLVTGKILDRKSNNDNPVSSM